MTEYFTNLMNNQSTFTGTVAALVVLIGGLCLFRAMLKDMKK